MKTPRLFLVLFLIPFAFFQSCTAVQNLPVNSEVSQAPAEEKAKIDRMIIYNAFLELIVEHPDSVSERISSIAKQYGGYLSASSNRRNQIRVKSENLEAAIADLSQMGKVKFKNIIGEDVTEAYTDFQIRLENAQKTRDRYLQLLDKAENIDDILKIEKELERLNQTIDLLKGKMNRINHLETFATITIDLFEENKPGVLGYVGVGLYSGVKWLFVRK